MRKLHLDIETYSSVDLKKTGQYRYAQSEDFQILMLAYAFDEHPVSIIDFMQGEELPEEVIEAFHDPGVIKCAHNAAFERICLSIVGYSIPTEQWECTAVKAAYCGLPLSLAAVSIALKLTDKSKDSAGKALIRYFCIPCKPTKANNQRTRNLPHHDLEKWNAFKAYCIQDVEAEREVDRLLSCYTIPKFEIENYILDQKINDRGVKIDRDIATNAAAIDENYRNRLIQRVIDITGIENPNSPSQLKIWLGNAMNKEITSLAKDILPDLIAEASGAALEVLKLRKRLSKSSTKKYLAMLECIAQDGRIRGLLQFYGANRTGRWAGRLVQVQNLPRTYIKDLHFTRALVKDNDTEVLEMMYGNISGTLSQLIRTAIVPSEGKVFAVADFSAIEARVIAWLAGEEWRLEVFRGHGKIYEASASMMFGVPVEQITKGSDLRAKGKVAELALGYQGGVGALTKMGGERMGLSEEEMKAIVIKWRNANPNIVKFWKRIEVYAKQAIKKQGRWFTMKGGKLSFHYDGGNLRIKLPSGRMLFYSAPRLAKGKFDQKVIKYWGMNQTTKRWELIDTYGGKLTENVVQAVARDLLAFAMQNLDKAHFAIVMHVHDEAVAEVPRQEGADPEGELKEMCEIMAIRPDWAEDIPLNADGYVETFYKKD